MKVVRSTKLSLKWMTDAKKARLSQLMVDYSKAVNTFIDLMWDWPEPPKNSQLLAEFLHQVPTTFSQRMLKEAAREAISMIRSVKCREPDEDKDDGIYVTTVTRPVHRGRKMVLACTCAELQDAKDSGEFDAWVRIKCIGNQPDILLPTKKTSHYHKWAGKGAEATTLVITADYVQVSFEQWTEPKQEMTHAIGVDTGINALATCSDGTTYGSEVRPILESLDRKVYGSKAYLRKRRHLCHVIDKTAKQVVAKAPVIVVERLKGIAAKTKQPKRRLGLKMRRWIGRWNVMYWLRRVRAATEENRVSFRSVPSYRTSTTCSVCGHSDPGNRPSQAEFSCLLCGHKANADVNASINIGRRFTSGTYGSGCKLIAV